MADDDPTTLSATGDALSDPVALDAPRTRRGRIRTLAAAVTITALCAWLVLSGLAPWWPALDGPLEAPPAHGSAMPVEVGERVTDAFDTLDFSGVDEILIERIEPVFNQDGITVLDISLSDVERAVGVPMQIYRESPPVDPQLGSIVPAVGAVIHEPPAGVPFGPQVLMGMKITREGHFLRNGFWVSYRVGAVHYREFFAAEMTFCTPTAMEGDRCPFLGGGTDLND